MDELLRLLMGSAPSSQTTSLFQRSMQPVWQGQPQYLPALEVTAPAPAPAPTPTIGEALRRAQIIDREADQNPGLAQLREEALQEAMARLETLKGGVSDAALAPLLFALGGAATAGQLAESAGQLTGLETLERGGRAVREGAGESLDIVGSTGAARVPYALGALAANYIPYAGVAKFAPFAARGGAAALAGRAIASAPVDVVQAAQQEGSTAQLLRQAAEAVGMERTANVLGQAEQSIPGRFAVEALTNIVPDVVMEYALPALRRGAQAAADVNADILASRRGAIDLGGGTPDVPTPEVPRVPEDVVPPAPPSPGDVPPGGPTPPVYTPVPPLPEPKKARYENLVASFEFENLEGEQLIKRVADEIAKDPEFQRRNIQTWDDLRKASEGADLPLDLRDISIEQARKLDGAKIYAIGAVTNRNANEAGKIAALLEKDRTLTPGVDIDPVTNQPYIKLTDGELTTLRDRSDYLDRQIQAGMRSLGAGRTVRGQEMNALKMTFQKLPDNPTYWLGRVERELGADRLEAIANVPIKKDGPTFYNEMMRLINAGDAEGLYTLVDKARRTPRSRLLGDFFKASILSALRSVAVNLVGIPRGAVDWVARNSGLTPLIDRALAATISAGKPGYLIPGPSVQQFDALLRGAIKKGPKQTIDAILGKPSARDVAEFRFSSSRTGGVTTPLDWAINFSRRMWAPAEREVRATAHEVSLAVQADAIARYENPKLDGDALKAKARALYDNPTDEMRLKALEDEDRAVFQSKSQVGGLLKTAGRGEIKGAGETLNIPIGALTVPFGTTPGAMAEMTYELSPLGVATNLLEIGAAGTRKLGAGAKTLVQRSRSGKPMLDKRAIKVLDNSMKSVGVSPEARRKISRSLAAGLVGTGGLFKLGMWLDSRGMISPILEDNERSARETLNMANIPEGALIVDDKYVDVNYAGGPTWAMVVAGAAYNQRLKQMAERGEVDELAKLGRYRALFGASGAAAKSLLEMPLFQSVQQVQQVLRSPVEEAPRFVENIGVNLLAPNLLASFARGMDPNIPEPRTFGERVMSRIPFNEQLANLFPALPQEIQPRLTPLGEPQKRLYPGVVNQALNPYRMMPVNVQDDLVVREIRNTGATISRRKQKDYESDAQYRANVAAEGQAIREQIIDLITTSDYLGMNRSDKALQLKKVVSDVQAEAGREARFKAEQQAVDSLNAVNVGVQYKPSRPTGYTPTGKTGYVPYKIGQYRPIN